MLQASYKHSFIVQATVITIVIYNCSVITVINYDRKTLKVQATDRELIIRSFVRPSAYRKY